MNDLTVPAFATEAEEAAWLYEHREERALEFIEAFAQGKVRRGSIAQKLEQAKNEALQQSQSKTAQLELKKSA